MKFRHLFYSLVMFGLSSISAEAQSVSTLPAVSAKGNRFVTNDGKPIIFRGLDASDPDKLAKQGHWNKEYFEQVKNWGANIIRFPVHPAAWRSRGINDYLKLLDSGIVMA
ncbi:MAG TPA: hypothetical protein VLC28_07835, partial [Flavitalea sp.]|nr:hypothetical protein [Flavitalea sp.]